MKKKFGQSFCEQFAYIRDSGLGNHLVQYRVTIRPEFSRFVFILGLV